MKPNAVVERDLLVAQRWKPLLRVFWLLWGCCGRKRLGDMGTEPKADKIIPYLHLLLRCPDF